MHSTINQSAKVAAYTSPLNPGRPGGIRTRVLEKMIPLFRLLRFTVHEEDTAKTMRMRLSIHRRRGYLPQHEREAQALASFWPRSYAPTL